MQFVNEDKKDKHYFSKDRQLLMLANYLHNNLYAGVKSPHFEEIYEDVKGISPDFLQVAEIHRPLTNRSPRLSEFTLETKKLLVSTMVGHTAEIQEDSRLISPMSPADTTNSNSIASEVTEATNEAREEAILNLLDYLKTFRSIGVEGRLLEVNMIFKEVKMHLPRLLSQIKDKAIDAQILTRFTEDELDKLHVIACAHKAELEPFMPIKQASDKDADALIKELSEYLNYVFVYLDVYANDPLALSLSDAEMMLHEVEKVSPQLKEIIFQSSYEDSIDDLILDLSDDEKSTLSSIAENYKDEIQKVTTPSQSPDLTDDGDATSDDESHLKF